MFCKKCGKEINENEAFCVYCGEKQDVNEIETNNQEKIISEDNSESNKYLKRAKILMEDGDMAKADEVLDIALENEPECAMAYLYKYSIEFGISDVDNCTSVEHYPSLSNFFTEKGSSKKGNNLICNYKLLREISKNYKNAIKFASGKLYDDLENHEYYLYYIVLKVSLGYDELAEDVNINWSLLPKRIFDEQDIYMKTKMEYVKDMIKFTNDELLKNDSDFNIRRAIKNLKCISSLPEVNEEIEELKSKIIERGQQNIEKAKEVANKALGAISGWIKGKK